MFNPIPREATMELKEELMSMYENKRSPILLCHPTTFFFHPVTSGVSVVWSSKDGNLLLAEGFSQQSGKKTTLHFII